MEGNSLTSFENLCKIFEMRIKLDRENGVKPSLDVLNNYEKYSKKIDSIYNSQFQKELKPLISPAVTLEKEEDRLRRLIRLLEDRLDRRNLLEDKFYKTTGKYMSDLQMIVSEEELENKKDRLCLISRYLDTNREIESVTESIYKLKDSLVEEEQKKIEYENKNKIMEDELYSSFMSVVNNDDYYKSINEEEIYDELDNIRSKVNETKETLDITKESVGSLLTSGLNDDYASYVEEAERAYFNYKNKELILKIYGLVTLFEDDFKQLCSKREKINELLREKRNLKENLSIDVEEELISFEKTLLLQCNSLEAEKEVLDNIANYISRINFKEERLDELKDVNNSVEILAILREYGLIETYDTEDTLLEEEVISDEVVVPYLEEEVIEEQVHEQVYNPYRIVEVNDYPKTLNVGLAKLKGESVREKVNKKLNPKKEESTFDDISSGIDAQNVVNEEVSIEIPEAEEGESGSELSLKDVSTNEEVTSEVKNEQPVTLVWDIPTDNVPETNTIEKKEEIPLPVWDIKPQFESFDTVSEPQVVNTIDIASKPEEVNNMFWVPVSESKVETNEFPHLNITGNNPSKNGEFVFPTINN